MRTPLRHETLPLREWPSQLGPLMASGPELRRSSIGVRRELWRVVDKYGLVLGIPLQQRRDAGAEETFLINHLNAYDVPEVIHADQLRSYRAAIWEIASLIDVDRRQGISTVRRNDVIERPHRPTWRQERQERGFKRRKRAQGFLNLHARY
jgi:putative transposase